MVGCLVAGRAGIERKKGADQGIDGRLYFMDDATGTPKQIVIQVKSGRLHANYVRDLRGVLDREGAETVWSHCKNRRSKWYLKPPQRAITSRRGEIIRACRS